MDEPQAPLTEREQFETWLMQHSSMRAFSSPSAAAKRRDEMYWYAHVRCAWQSWQARAALASAPHPPSNTLGDALTGPGDPVASLPTPPIAAGEVRSAE